MNTLSSISLCVLLSVSCTPCWAETVVAMQGQTSQQTQLDIDDCHDVALSQGTPPAPATGTTVAEQPGRQHDEFYEGGDDTSKTAFISCLQGKDYQVNP
ncbi:hypothetical protein [Pseudomonas sp. NPDC099000]|uniref:hypothetical protein n=1 Tax=Pseudomonas sp. NPDC099000 TaxID=3364488 RepID=UPI00383A52A1